MYSLFSLCFYCYQNTYFELHSSNILNFAFSLNNAFKMGINKSKYMIQDFFWKQSCYFIGSLSSPITNIR